MGAPFDTRQLPPFPPQVIDLDLSHELGDSTMHRRGEFDPAARRLMKRNTILPPADRAVPV